MEDLSALLIPLWSPKDRRPIYEWAADHVELGPPLTLSGFFDVTKSRQLLAPFDSFADERKRETNLLAPVRGAKTLFADVCHQHIICIRPGPTLFLFQDEKAARDQAELRTWPNIARNLHAARMLSHDRHKNRTCDIIFPHMPLHIRGPADSNLQSRGYQFVFLDEPHQYKEGKIEEARGRLGDFVKMGTDKLVCLSQGGAVGSDWARQYARGLIHEWHVQCAKCGHYMTPRWTGHRSDGTTWGMKWDKHKTPAGLWDIGKCLSSIRFECEACAHPHIWGARTKAEWNRTGKYVVEDAPDKLPSKDSFHWTAVIDYPWDQLTDLYLQAVNAWKLGTVEPLIQFFQKRMGEMSSEESMLENRLNFSRSVYEIKSKPEEATRLLTVDRQAEDVYWVVARDWFVGGKSRRVHFGKCFSLGEIEELRIKLGVHCNHTLIDSGWKPKGDHGVYGACIRYGWVPLKGAGAENGEPIYFTHGGDVRIQRTYSEPIPVDAEIGTENQDKNMVEMLRFSSPTYFDRVLNLIDRGLWIEPDDASGEMEREYKTQMASEYKRAIVVGNKNARRTKMVVVCPSGNNHAMDCSKMQVLGATLLEFLPDLEVTEVSRG